uniref:Protein kinase domain-containing protein n=1 Tax=Parastrongyloides trichosuri TaxID=131310 RepID=A0A0N4ZSH0_PARTI
MWSDFSEEEINNCEFFQLSDVFKRHNINRIVQKIDDFEILNFINEGTYGNVYRVKRKDNNNICALKKIYYFNSDPNIVKSFMREVLILQELLHPNVIKVNGYAQDMNDGSIYIEYPYYQESLCDMMSKICLEESKVKLYIYQLFDALSYIHSKKIIHRDITPSNILISSTDNIVLIDFNISKKKDYNKIDSDNYSPCLTTIRYKAPEVILDVQDYNETIDVWGAGCILYELINKGNPLFDGEGNLEQLQKIFCVLGIPNEDTFPGFNNIQFFKCFSVEINEFKSIKDLLKERIVDLSIFDLFYQIFTYNYKERISAEECKRHPYLER